MCERAFECTEQTVATANYAFICARNHEHERESGKAAANL